MKQRRAESRRLILGRVRSVFGCLFMATVLVFAFCHRADLQEYLISHAYQWSQAETKSGALRQSALNYENEVNQIFE